MVNDAVADRHGVKHAMPPELNFLEPLGHPPVGLEQRPQPAAISNELHALGSSKHSDHCNEHGDGDPAPRRLIGPAILSAKQRKDAKAGAKEQDRRTVPPQAAIDAVDFQGDEGCRLVLQTSLCRASRPRHEKHARTHRGRQQIRDRDRQADGGKGAQGGRSGHGAGTRIRLRNQSLGAPIPGPP